MAKAESCRIGNTAEGEKDIFHGAKKLGFGLMRLPLTDENDGGSIDVRQVCDMVDLFIKRGFTYFDTAWMYCAFRSENATREFLVDRYPRESYTLATKLHAGFLHAKEDRDLIFEEQRKKTGVDYFDYYLLHDMGVDHYRIYQELDCFSWIVEKKKAGLVRHIGFSFHDTADVLDKILTEHPEMEFVQLQLNYLDWENQGIQSRKCLEVARRHGKPVIAMEPVKGGTLAKVPSAVETLFKISQPTWSAPSWAIRFVAGQDGVQMVLSGMSNMEQVEDNTSFMQDFRPLTEGEQMVIDSAVRLFDGSIAVPCTGCSYCTEGCPQKIAIPRYFSLYNADLQEIPDKGWTIQNGYYHRLTELFGAASSCIGCGRCESVCPQHISVIEQLKKVADRFEK